MIISEFWRIQVIFPSMINECRTGIENHFAGSAFGSEWIASITRALDAF